ncbi:MAG: orotate phosphoribosyltransferase [Candidatus Eremiobacteraeota bacterium]|nr:orotate phosphoribosyltransferase [Candidatus Eremiobacteraeota bacterium]
MSLTEVDLRSALAERGALLQGHFRLSSGRHSDRFVQKFRILEDPVLLERVARELADRFRSLEPTIVVGAAVGGILLAYEVARQLGTKAIFVEKVNGVPALRRGFALSPHDRALLVEDVLTTGQSMRETVEVVRATGASIVGLGVIVARGTMGDAGFPTHALLELPLQSYDEAQCPQCRAEEPLSDPGSRRA